VDAYRARSQRRHRIVSGGLTVRVVVIGAGAIGLACAYSLQKAGAEVVVLDAQEVGAGASRRNAGWIVPSMSGPVPAPGLMLQSLRWMAKRDSPLRVRPQFTPEFARFMVAMLRHCNRSDFDTGLRATLALNDRTFELFDAMQQDGVRFEHHRRGLFLMFQDPANLRAHSDEFHKIAALGAGEAATLDAEQIRAQVPQVSADVIGAIDCPSERFVEPNSYVDGLAAVLRDRGVAIHTYAPVTSVECSAAGKVRAVIGCDRWAADAFVIAAGSASGRLSRLFKAHLRVQPGRGYGFDVAAPSRPFTKALYLSEGKVAITPFDDRVRLSGTMEFGTGDRPIDQVRAAGILHTARTYLSGWPRERPAEYATTRAPVRAAEPPWVGKRPMTPDGLPIIGLLPGHDNVVAATGHAMLGITLSPVTGDVVRSILLDGVTPVEAQPFHANR
jgi:D-amino-acid dehydrogenase